MKHTDLTKTEIIAAMKEELELVNDKLATKACDPEHLTIESMGPGITILAGRPSTGKTSLALKIAASAPRKISTLFCSIEQNKESILNLAKKVSDDLIARLHILDSPFLAAADILDELHLNPSIGVVVVDYLGLLKTSDVEFLEKLKSALPPSITVLAISQLSKNADVSGAHEHFIPNAGQVLPFASRVILLGAL
jgi:replicative DNA helicase